MKKKYIQYKRLHQAIHFFNIAFFSGGGRITFFPQLALSLLFHVWIKIITGWKDA